MGKARLRYFPDEGPGIRRRRCGTGFMYIDPRGERIDDPKVIARIKSIVIPPAWRDVWICPDPAGHVQATGRDARGRKQHRYHPRWREMRDETKYSRLIAFCEKLPLIRQGVQEDISRKGLPREKVLATVVQLLETTLIRIGNHEYARENRSFGLTTFRDRHVRISGSKLQFIFHGKGGKQHDIALRDRRLARIVRQCRDLPGYDLFQYVDAEGRRQTIGSGDVNAYLRELTGEEFTAKDFRTWGGTVLATTCFLNTGDADIKKNIVRVIKSVAAALGNTPATCRKYYIHPAIIEGYADGTLVPAITGFLAGKRASPVGGLAPEERAVLAFLKENSAQKGKVAP